MIIYEDLLFFRAISIAFLNIFLLGGGSEECIPER